VYQKRRIPDPLARSRSFSADQVKNPKLSKTMAITIVAIMVTAAPPIVSVMLPKSDKVTLPLRRTSMAPTVAGIDSLTFGCKKIKVMVHRNDRMVIGIMKSCSIIVQPLFDKVRSSISSLPSL
jgi:hypothetical protein